MNLENILNIILVAALFLFSLRDIVANAVEKDFSQKKYPFILRWFLTSKEHIVAKKFLNELGFSYREDLVTKVKGKKERTYKGAIELLSKCIIKADDNETYKFGSDDGCKHKSCYYVDSQGFAQKKENCRELYDIMVYLIKRVEMDYKYVFSIKGGNIPLAATFSIYDSDVLSIMPKDRNEEVDSGSSTDFEINYEGFRFLIDKAKQNENNKIKGIAITCNLSNGGAFLNSIKKYNDKIEELQKNGIITRNIKKIENVYILYRAITGDTLDNNFNKAGLKCYRYFDLDDNSKEILYSIKNKEKEIHDFPCYNCIKWKRRPKTCTAKHCYRALIK